MNEPQRRGRRGQDRDERGEAENPTHRAVAGRRGGLRERAPADEGGDSEDGTDGEEWQHRRRACQGPRVPRDPGAVQKKHQDARGARPCEVGAGGHDTAQRDRDARKRLWPQAVRPEQQDARQQRDQDDAHDREADRERRGQRGHAVLELVAAIHHQRPRQARPERAHVGANRDAGVDEVDRVARAGTQQRPQGRVPAGVLDEVRRHGEFAVGMKQGPARFPLDDREVHVARRHRPVERVQGDVGGGHRRGGASSSASGAAGVATRPLDALTDTATAESRNA